MLLESNYFQTRGEWVGYQNTRAGWVKCQNFLCDILNLDNAAPILPLSDVLMCTCKTLAKIWGEDITHELKKNYILPWENGNRSESVTKGLKQPQSYPDPLNLTYQWLPGF